MIDKDAAAQLVMMARAVQKYAKAGDKAKETPKSKEAHEHAWILLTFLADFAQGIKESDLAFTLSDTPGKTHKQQVKHSLNGTAWHKSAWAAARDFEKRLAKFELGEAGIDPEAKPYAVFPAKPAAKKPAATKVVAKKPAAKKAVAKKAA